MTTLSAEQIYAAAIGGGFSPEQAVIATAIAFGESGGRIEALGDRDQGNSYGLWQIHWPSHYNKIIDGEPLSQQRLQSDPIYAAKVAYIVSGEGTNWNPWTVFKNGAYQKFLPQATAAAQASGDGAIDVGAIAQYLPQGTGADDSGGPSGYGEAVMGTPAAKTGTEVVDPATGLAPSQANDPAVVAFLTALNQNPDELVRARFPAYALYLSDPELGPILRDAVQHNWDALRLQTAVQNTDWWKNTSSSIRQWDQIVAADPATAQSQRDAKMQQISQQFATIGYVPDTPTLAKITEDALRNGWDAARVTDAIVKALPATYAPGQIQAGDIQATMGQLTVAASDYYIPLSEGTSYDWAKRISAGTLSGQAAQEMLRQQAKANFAWLAPQIDQGITVKDFFAPMQQNIAKIMGTSADGVDLQNDPYWSQLTRITDGNGLARQPTFADAQRLARQHKDYGGTVDGINRATNFVMAARQTFEGA